MLSKGASCKKNQTNNSNIIKLIENNKDKNTKIEKNNIKNLNFINNNNFINIGLTPKINYPSSTKFRNIVENEGFKKIMDHRIEKNQSKKEI